MRIDRVISLILFISFSGNFVSAHAPGPHPPHGGQMFQGKYYFYEMLVMPLEIRLYVLNRALKPIPLDGWEGSLSVRYPDGSEKNLPLEKNEEFFKADFALDDPKSFIAIANLRINGKSDIGRFAF